MRSTISFLLTLKLFWDLINFKSDFIYDLTLLYFIYR